MVKWRDTLGKDGQLWLHLSGYLKIGKQLGGEMLEVREAKLFMEDFHFRRSFWSRRKAWARLYIESETLNVKQDSKAVAEKDRPTERCLPSFLRS